MDLFPQPVEWVSATTHKRVWHDVTNADHSRVLVHFADGVEAEFTHSDLSAALKPKFYVLGTEGGLIGDWRFERSSAARRSAPWSRTGWRTRTRRPTCGCSPRTAPAAPPRPA